MVGDIHFGQYIPGDSFLHKLDPRSKILSTMVFMVTLFMSRNSISLGLSFLSIVFIILFSGISLKIYFKSIKYIAIFMFVSCMFNALYGCGDTIFKFWIFNVTLQSIINSLFVFLKILSLVLVSGFVTFTTSPNDIAFAIETFMSPLKFLKVNVQDISTMITLSLRFIPVVFEETNKLINAQKSRGADFENKNIIKKIKAYIPIMPPMFFLSFKKAEDLAVAMESRCYNDFIKRTRIKGHKIKIIDILYLAYIMVTLLGVVCCNFLI